MPPKTEDLITGQESLAPEIARRRTFAIISHPDAGKTTLTEKLLLYAGAIELAGAVRGSKTQRHAVSDWMEMEQQRGISISAAALEFELEGHHVTLLDTPGHQDFSEDTYRTLLAVDSVVMVLDAAKGVEPQTLKLFEVCRSRGLPVLTFINKLDQPARDPFELLDQIEHVLGISAAPMNWPLGDGPDFKGVFDLEANAVLLYERQARGRRTQPVVVASAQAEDVTELVGERRQKELMDAIAFATGVRPVFTEAPPDTRAEQLTDPHIDKDGFLDLFGRPSRESSCECERRSDLSLPQALNLVNGKTISDAVADGAGRIAKAILSGKPDRDLVEDLYLASLSRPPAAAELESGLKYLRMGPGRAARAQDLLWALVNSKAFLYNY